MSYFNATLTLQNKLPVKKQLELLEVNVVVKGGKFKRETHN
jgi:hypothetical protein